MLSPYRVVDLSSGGAGLCGQILADLGADVVLVEPPGGIAERRLGPFVAGRADPDSSLGFWALHRNQRSVVLDPDEAIDRERLSLLIDGADVLVTCQSAAWLAARGLDHASLVSRNPGLVSVSITPFGLEGPKAEWAATDLTLTAASGVMVLTGDHDRAPLTSSVPQAWLHGGSDGAVGAVLALLERAGSGRGQLVDVSVQTSKMFATQSFALSHGWGDLQAGRAGGGARVGDVTLRYVYPCRDGWVNFTFLFGPAFEKFTGRMFEWMHEEGFIDAATRDKDWGGYAALLLSGQEPIEEFERLKLEVERFTLAHTKAELYRGALERRVLIVPLSDARDLAESQQLAARDFWTEVEHPELGRRVRYPGPFSRASARPIEYRRRPPRLGEHQAEVLENLAARAPSRVGSAPRDLPLAGVKVLDFSWVIAGPAITHVLALYGATVVRVECERKLDALRSVGPHKDQTPSLDPCGYCNTNVGKLGISLDLSVEAGRDVARQLVGWADVVVENFSPRAMRGWGLDYERLREIKPDVIMLSSCLMGQDGPEAGLAGFGTMGAALAGFGLLTGWADRAPSSPFGAYTDYVSPRFAISALLAALDHRRRTGEGQYLDNSQLEAGTHLLADVLLDYHVNGRIATANGNRHPHHAPSGVYPVQGDDRWIALAAPEPEHFAELAKLAGRDWPSDARFATPEARHAHVDALDDEIAAWTRDQDVDALEGALQERGIPAHRVSTSADLFDDPQLAAREHFIWLEHPAHGSVPVEAARMRLCDTPPVYTHPGPMIGEHTDAVLREILGLDDDAVTELVIAGALG